MIKDRIKQEEKTYYQQNGSKMNPNQIRKKIKQIYMEQVPAEKVITHYTRVTQLEVRLKNIAIHQIEKRRHEKARDMLRKIFQKIINQHNDLQNRETDDKNDLYQMIVNDINNLQN